MSTNKTTNFGLSQWQSTDPIRVADFNADNLKLDTALKELRDCPGFQKIQEHILEKSEHTLSYDLSGIDWKRWSVVRMDLHLINGQGSEGYVHLNGGGSYISLGGGTNSMFLKAEVRPENSPEQPGPTRMFLLPMGNEDEYVRAISFSNHGLLYSYLNTPYKQINKMTITSNGSAFRTGCKFTIYGMK